MKDKTVQIILQQTEDIYNNIADVFFNTRRKPWPMFAGLEKFFSQAESIVDFGCGSGRLAGLAATNGKKYLGIEVSQNLIGIAKKNYAEVENIEFRKGDITKLKARKDDKDFDLALMIAVLHHLPSAELRLEALKTAANFLRPGGLIILSNWNLWQKDYRRYFFDYKNKLARGVFGLFDAFIPWRSATCRKMRYVHSFRKKEIEEMLISSGFAVEKIYYEFQGNPSSIFRGRNLVAIARKK